MTVLILLGAPGSGKGTQAELISEKYSLPIMTMGDIIRNEIKLESELGVTLKSFLDKGELVPDSVISDLFISKVTKESCEAGFISDGVPRTLFQAEQLDKALDSFEADYKVILIKVTLENILERLKRRQRSDDTEEVIKNRFRIYEEELSPILDFYRNKLEIVDGEQEIEDVFADICKLLN